MPEQVTREKTGSCACGAVTFTVSAPDTYGACHCQMCRRWTGGVWMGVVIDEVIEIAGPLKEWRSSKIGARGYCSECGSSIWHEVKNPKTQTFGQGLFDDQSGWTMTREIFTDAKPDHYALAADGQTALTGWGTLWAFLLGRLPK